MGAGIARSATNDCRLFEIIFAAFALCYHIEGAAMCVGATDSLMKIIFANPPNAVRPLVYAPLVYAPLAFTEDLRRAKHVHSS